MDFSGSTQIDPTHCSSTVLSALLGTGITSVSSGGRQREEAGSVGKSETFQTGKCMALCKELPPFTMFF